VIVRHLTLLIFMVLACATRAEAEPISIRCDGKYYQQQQPYFVTYDLEKNHFVFERPGGNIITGEIIAANDARLDFSLRATGGRILFSFNRQRNVMTWPGMPAGELGRPLLQHACTAVSDRTMLSTFYQPEQFDPKRLDPVDAFSLTCPGNTGPFFITLDRATKIVVVETEHASGILSGNITGIDNGVIKLTFGRGPSDPHDALWDERSRSLTLIGVPDDAARPTKVQQCIVTKPRSIMVNYEEWARWGK
jgi:hypothetical protein